MMPRRRHTRAHNTAKAIAAERRLNDASSPNETNHHPSEATPLLRSDGEQPPLAGHALELVRAAVLELQP